MYVATATDRHLAEAALRHAGIDGYFRGLITVAEVGVGKKESAEIVRAAMRRLQSNKKDTVVFEDAFHAIQTAKAAGFRVAAVYDASEEAHQEEIRGWRTTISVPLRRCLRPGSWSDRLPQKARPVRQDRAGFSVRESGSPPRGRRQMPSAYWRRPAAPCGNCRCPGLRPGAPPGGRHPLPEGGGQGSRRGGVRLHGGEHTAQHRQHTARAGDERHPAAAAGDAPDPRPIGDDILRTGELLFRGAGPGPWRYPSGLPGWRAAGYPPLAPAHPTPGRARAAPRFHSQDGRGEQVQQRPDLSQPPGTCARPYRV